MPQRTISVETKYFMFRQSNSGGQYHGPRFIVIEATDSESANMIAESKTDIYFNGSLDGRDCSCCGDRWYKCYDDGYDTIYEAIQYHEDDFYKEKRGETPIILHFDDKIETVTGDMFNSWYWKDENETDEEDLDEFYLKYCVSG